MTSSSSKPIIVIVPGSFTTPDYYDIFLDKLSSHGYDGVAINPPSIGEKPATMTDDAAEVARVTSKFADQGKDVILISHSYGGVPASESAKGLGKKERQAAGKKGGISALLYVTALLVEPGQSLGSTMGDAVPNYVHVEGDFMTLGAEGNSKVTYSDLPLEEALAWASKMPHHSTATFGGELTYPAYRHIPASYLFMLDDKVIPLEMQRSMVEKANQHSESQLITYSSRGGHFPFISTPDSVIEVVRKVAGESL